MRFAKITDRVAGLGSDKWAVHFEGKQRRDAGEKLIFLSIGEPDTPPASAILDVAATRMKQGRTRYSGGNGEEPLLQALSAHYSKQTGRAIAVVPPDSCVLRRPVLHLAGLEIRQRSVGVHPAARQDPRRSLAGTRRCNAL